MSEPMVSTAPQPWELRFTLVLVQAPYLLKLLSTFPRPDPGFWSDAQGPHPVTSFLLRVRDPRKQSLHRPCSDIRVQREEAGHTERIEGDTPTASERSWTIQEAKEPRALWAEDPGHREQDGGAGGRKKGGGDDLKLRERKGNRE